VVVSSPVAFAPSTLIAPENMTGDSKSSGAAWYAAYTEPRHEKFVQAQLVAKQIQSFLPLYRTVRRWKNGVRREVEHPLFPGYIFVCMGASERLPVIQTTGVVYIVGNRTSPLPLHEHEMQALLVGAQRGSLLPHPFPCRGDKVCITGGAFQGVTGYVEQHQGDLTLVVTIQLIQKAFAIRVKTIDLALID
jgi:transcription antitermination factor NusG